MSIIEKVNELNSRRQNIETHIDEATVNTVHSNNMLTARERITELLDDNSFVEIGVFVNQRSTDFNLNKEALPADGVITGYGAIEGRLVYVYSQDSAVLGGAMGEMHAKKIVRLYEMAIKMRAPIVGIVDSVGLRLQEATDALDAFGQIYVKQSQASGVIPQITAILGTCGGGTAVIPSLADFTVMTNKNAKLFVNSPNALNDKEATMEEYTSAVFHAKTTGVVDFVANDDKEALSTIKELLGFLPSSNMEETIIFPDELDNPNRVSETIMNIIGNNDGIEIIKDIADNNRIFQVKEYYGEEVITALGMMNNTVVGFISNNRLAKDEGRITREGAIKVINFVKFCDSFNIPLVNLVDILGFSTDVEQERRGLSVEIARMTNAFVQASVPKISVVLDEAYGSAYVAMNSKHIGADIALAWPTAKISMMEAKSAIHVMCADSNQEEKEKATRLYEEMQGSAFSAASRGYIDDIIEPAATRKRIIAALEMLYLKNDKVSMRKHTTL